MSDAVEPLDLDAVRERWGEWYGRDGYVGTPARWDDIDDGESPDHYIVRQDVPALLAEVERLRVALTTARRDALTEAADSVDDAGRYWFGTNDRQRLRARAAQEEGR